jgi:hypothetical protein
MSNVDAQRVALDRLTTSCPGEAIAVSCRCQAGCHDHAQATCRSAAWIRTRTIGTKSCLEDTKLVSRGCQPPARAPGLCWVGWGAAREIVRGRFSPVKGAYRRRLTAIALTGNP